METNKEILENAPMKGIERLQNEYDIINFSNKAVERLIVAVENSMEKCTKFYKKVSTTQNRCKTSLAKMLQEFSAQVEHLKYLYDRLQKDELHIQLVKGLNENVIKRLVVQGAVSNGLLEDQLRVTTLMVADIKTQLSKHEVTVRFFEPTYFETIATDVVAWKQFMNESNRTT